jgi:hypothetical protein
VDHANKFGPTPTFGYDFGYVANSYDKAGNFVFGPNVNLENLTLRFLHSPKCPFVLNVAAGTTLRKRTLIQGDKMACLEKAPYEIKLDSNPSTNIYIGSSKFDDLSQPPIDQDKAPSEPSNMGAQ